MATDGALDKLNLYMAGGGLAQRGGGVTRAARAGDLLLFVYAFTPSFSVPAGPPSY